MEFRFEIMASSPRRVRAPERQLIITGQKGSVKIIPAPGTSGFTSRHAARCSSDLKCTHAQRRGGPRVGECPMPDALRRQLFNG